MKLNSDTCYGTYICMFPTGSVGYNCGGDGDGYARKDGNSGEGIDGDGDYRAYTDIEYEGKQIGDGYVIK